MSYWSNDVFIYVMSTYAMPVWCSVVIYVYHHIVQTVEIDKTYSDKLCGCLGKKMLSIEVDMSYALSIY